METSQSVKPHTLVPFRARASQIMATRSWLLSAVLRLASWLDWTSKPRFSPTSRALEPKNFRLQLGLYWKNLLEDVALPASLEYRLLLRKVATTSSSARSPRRRETWSIDDERMICIPPRSCHQAAHLPTPSTVSNELFIGCAMHSHRA